MEVHCLNLFEQINAHLDKFPQVTRDAGFLGPEMHGTKYTCAASIPFTSEALEIDKMLLEPKREQTIPSIVMIENPTWKVIQNAPKGEYVLVGLAEETQVDMWSNATTQDVVGTCVVTESSEDFGTFLLKRGETRVIPSKNPVRIKAGMAKVVVGEEYRPNAKRYIFWGKVLPEEGQRGIWTYKDKLPDCIFYSVLGAPVMQMPSKFQPILPIATAPWLTSTQQQQQRKHKSPSPENKDSTDKLQSMFDRHDALREQIALLPPHSYDEGIDEVASKHRVDLVARQTTLISKDRQPYENSLKTLARNIETAQRDEPVLRQIFGILEKCTVELDRLENHVAKPGSKFLISVNSKKREVDKLRGARKVTLAGKLKDVQELETCIFNMEGKSAAAVSIAIPSNPEDNVIPLIMEGQSLSKFLYDCKLQVGTLEKLIAEKVPAPEARVLLGEYKRQVQSAVDAVKVLHDKKEQLQYDVGTVSAYKIAMDELSKSVEIAARKAKKSAPQSQGTKRPASVCSECEEAGRLYKNGKCEACFVEELDEEALHLDEMESAFRKEIKNEDCPESVKSRYETFTDLCLEVHDMSAKYRDGEAKLQDYDALVHKAKDYYLETFENLKQEEDDGSPKPMDEEEDDDDDDEEEEEEESSSSFEASDDEEEYESDSSSSSSSSLSSKKKKCKTSSSISADKIASRLLDIQERVPLKAAIHQIQAWYKKKDQDSLMRAHLKLKDLEGLTEVWGVKHEDSVTYFETEEEAKRECRILKLETGSQNVQVMKKTL